MSEPGLSGLLGAGTSWNGDLTFDGRVRVDGSLTGRVTTPDFLEVGPTGVIVGTVDAAQVLIAGRVNGTVKARERITVLETGRVTGRLDAPWIDIRAGAQLDARVSALRDMTADFETLA